MGVEVQDIKIAKELTDEFTEPIFGKKHSDSDMAMGLPKKTKMGYATGCLLDDDFKEWLSQLMEKSLQCNGWLSKPGDACVIKEEGSFDKDGCYRVMVKYLYIPE